MFDDLRNDDQPMFEGEQVKKTETVLSMPNRSVAKNKKNRKILGMTAVQRFVVATLLFLMVCMVGMAVLFVTGKITFF